MILNLFHLLADETDFFGTLNCSNLSVIPLTSDTTPLNHNTILIERTSSISLNSTIMNTQKTFNVTKNLTQQDTQTPSHFIYEEIVETLPTTSQQNISPTHPTVKIP